MEKDLTPFCTIALGRPNDSPKIVLQSPCDRHAMAPVVERIGRSGRPGLDWKCVGKTTGIYRQLGKLERIHARYLLGKSVCSGHPPTSPLTDSLDLSGHWDSAPEVCTWKCCEEREYPCQIMPTYLSKVFACFLYTDRGKVEPGNVFPVGP